jgi:hypothetical protein
MFVVLEGPVAFMVNGATTRLGPGSAGMPLERSAWNRQWQQCPLRYTVF